MRLVRADSGADESEIGLGILLGALAAPGAFQSFMFLDKYSYSTFYNWLSRRPHMDLSAASAPNKYMLLSLGMAVTGIITVLKWDRILPDSQDYLNLAPLPVRPRAILLANTAAVAIAVLVCALDVNAASTVLFPLFLSAATDGGPAALVQSIGIHGFCLILASLFTFCAVFASMGALAAILPRERFRAWSPSLRGGVLVAFLMLLLSAFAGPDAMRHIVRLEWLPSWWFLGLYESLQGAASPDVALLAHRALAGTCAALITMMVTYAASYRRRFAGVLENGGPPSERRLLAAALAGLDVLGKGTHGFHRAGYRFVIRALLRNEVHRMFLVASLGVSWLLALQNGSPREGPLIAAYLMVLALRLAFEIPAVAQANWVFRTAADIRAPDARALARHVMLAFVMPLVWLPCLAWDWSREGVLPALIHTMYVLGLALCLIEILLSGYRKIPLTSSMPGFRHNLPLLCVLQFLGFEAFTHLGAALETWMFGQPARFLFVPAAMLAAWHWNHRRLHEARQAGELETALCFDSAPAPVMQRLNLFDAE